MDQTGTGLLRSPTDETKYMAFITFVDTLAFTYIWEVDHLQWQSQYCEMHYNVVTMYYNIVFVSIVKNGLQ